MKDNGMITADPQPDYRPYCQNPNDAAADAVAYEGHPYPASYQPPSPFANDLLQRYRGQIKDARGRLINPARLTGVSVALYFGAGNLRKCRNITPWLVNYYETINAASDRQKLEIIYCPLDKNVREYNAHRGRMPWLALDWDELAIEEFQKQYNIFAPLDRPVYGFGPRYTAPHLTLISDDGATYRDIDLLNEETIRCNLRDPSNQAPPETPDPVASKRKRALYALGIADDGEDESSCSSEEASDDDSSFSSVHSDEQLPPPPPLPPAEPTKPPVHLSRREPCPLVRRLEPVVVLQPPPPPPAVKRVEIDRTEKEPANVTKQTTAPLLIAPAMPPERPRPLLVPTSVKKRALMSHPETERMGKAPPAQTKGQEPQQTTRGDDIMAYLDFMKSLQQE